MEKTGRVGHPELIANRSRVEKNRGQGGMGVVYQVRGFSPGRRLAPKQLKLRHDTRERVELEEFLADR